MDGTYKSFITRGSLVILAIGLVGLGLGLFVAPDAPQGTFVASPRPQGGVLLADLETEEENLALIGELTLKDPTPLFLPTQWNSGQVDQTMTAERSSGASFRQLEAKWVFSDDENRLELPDGVEVPGTALATIDQMEPRLPSGELARRDLVREKLPERGGYFEVIAVTTGQIVLQRVLEADAASPLITSPLEAMLDINASGFWLRPTVAQVVEGGAVEFDRVNLMLRQARLETILAPGFYRISLGP